MLLRRPGGLVLVEGSDGGGQGLEQDVVGAQSKGDLAQLEAESVARRRAEDEGLEAGASQR